MTSLQILQAVEQALLDHPIPTSHPLHRALEAIIRHGRTS